MTIHHFLLRSLGAKSFFLVFILAQTLSAGPASAAEPELVGILALAADDGVAQSLGLSAETRQALRDLIDRREAEAINLVQEIRTLSPDERAKRLAPFVQESERLGLALLTDEQRTKLRQMRLAREGLATLGDASLAGAVGLTDEQQAQVRSILTERAAVMARGSETEQRLARAEFERRLAGVLTESQLSAWRNEAGLQPTTDQAAQASSPPQEAPAAAPPSTPAPSIQSPASPAESPSPVPQPPSSTTPAPTPSTSAPTQPQASPVPNPFVPLQPAPPQPASSQAPASPQQPPNAAAPGGAPPAADRSTPRGVPLESDASGPPREDVQLRFNFRYAPWKDVIEWFAQQANLSLEGEAPLGTFNYTDNRSYTPSEALDLLNSVLLTKGYTLLRKDRILFVVNLADLEGGIPPNLVTRVTPEELDERGEYEIVSVLFPLTKMTPEQAEAELRPLLGRPGEMVILPLSKQAWITATGGRLKTIRKVIQAVDAPETTKDLNKYKVEHVAPDEALTVVRKLMGIADDASGMDDGSIRFTVDPLSGNIFVSGQPDMIQRFEQILEMVDVESNVVAGGPGALETPQLEVYPVTDADPNTALQVLQTLLAGMPDVRLTIDPVTGSIIAMGRPAEHNTIRATLAQLQNETRQIEVIRLYRLDPQLAVLSINRMFGGGTETPDPKAPVVDADPTSGMLLVRGTQTQIAQIKKLLEQMGEAPEALAGNLGAAGVSPMGGNIRVLPLTGRVARDVLEQVELLWPTMRQNRIRIVRPTASIDARRLNTDEPSLRTPGDDLNGTGAPFSPSPGLNAPLPSLPPSPPDNGAPDNAIPADSDAAYRSAGRSMIRKVVIGAGRPPRSSATLAKEYLAAQALLSAGSRESDGRLSVIPVAEREGNNHRASAAFAVERTLVAQADRPQDASKQAESSATAGQTAPNASRLPGSPSEIIVRVTPSGIIIASEDLEALDEFETLLRTLTESTMAGGTEYTVFYLKYVQATVAADLITQLVTGAPLDEGGGGGGMMGALMGAALGDVGGGLVSNLLSGGGSTTSTYSSTGFSVVPEPRLNALVVQASPQHLDMIEQLLKVIDQESSPEMVQTLPPPRMIPVFNTNAETVANTVRQIYAQQIASGSGQQRQPSPEDLVRALRGGGEGRSSRNRAEQAVQQMTVSVDARSNSLVVSAPDPLFMSVKALVEALDQPGMETPQTTQVVSITGANAATVRQALTAILGDVIQTSTPTSSSSTPASSSSTPQPEAPRTSTSDDFREQLRQRFEMFNAFQRGGDSGGSRSGGGSPFGGRSFGGGDRGGSRGGDRGRGGR